MLITQPQINTYSKPITVKSYDLKQNSHQVTFCADPSKEPLEMKFYRFSEQAMRVPENALRRISNSLASITKKSLIDKCYNSFVHLDEKSPEYIKSLTEIGRFWAQNKEFEVNIQDKRLDDIVNSDEACIFIMNHDHQAQDPVLLGCMTNLLYSKYLEAGKGETCPRPNIVINEDILSTQPDKMRAIFEKMGAIGVDASLIKNPSGGKRNIKKLIPMMTGFTQDSKHIFIFPEGKMCAFNDLELNQKFQSGVGELIKLASSGKKRVKVVPLGFDYNSKSKNFLGSIYIGEPVYFKQENKQILVSTGNITQRDALPNYSQYFMNENNANPLQSIDNVDYKVLTIKGKPVKGKETKQYISGVLAENLRICKNKAHEQLPKNCKSEQEITWV